MASKGLRVDRLRERGRPCCPCTPRPDLDVTVAHGESESSADPVSSLSPAVALLVNHAVDIVERLGVAVTPAGEVALQAGLPRVHHFFLCDGR